ncbi:glycosyl hydrolase family 28-related protein [Sphingobacterium sp.]|uniref:glycosyl hydrolase family 28-related protein n=1 Tax=Sphingobacterium sp. TaxID=341027 RepID=UPI0031D4C370
MENQFLIKNSIADLRNMSASEIDSLKGTFPTYQGVKLLGYYTKGDIPNAVNYYLTNSSDNDNGGNVIVVGDIKLQYALPPSLDVRYFGAKGDGNTDDTDAIQRAINTKATSILFPTPQTAYRVSTIYPLTGQTLKGDGQPSKQCIMGNGVDTTIIIGSENFALDRIMRITIQELRISNDGNDAIYVRNCPNVKILNSYISSVGGIAIKLFYSWRINISNNWINSSGTNTWGVYGMNNINGLICNGNTITGGSSGGAICIGNSQNVAVKHNIIETSLKGIYIGSGDFDPSGIGQFDPNDGGVNGLEIDNNYIENCLRPLAIGVRFFVGPGSVSNNFIATGFAKGVNGGTYTVDQFKEKAILQLGRNRGIKFSNNSFSCRWSSVLDFNTEYINQENAIPFMYDCSFGDNNIGGREADIPLYKFTGKYASSTYNHYKRLVGGRNYFGFFVRDKKGCLSSYDNREYISPLIFANTGLSIRAWIDQHILELGGSIISVDLIDVQGNVDGAKLYIGSSGDNGSALSNYDVGSIPKIYGAAQIPDINGGSRIYTDLVNTIKVIPSTSETSNGSFRVKITYRAT